MKGGQEEGLTVHVVGATWREEGDVGWLRPLARQSLRLRLGLAGPTAIDVTSRERRRDEEIQLGDLHLELRRRQGLYHEAHTSLELRMSQSQRRSI